MIIAIPIWENRVSPVLDTAGRLLVLDRNENGQENRREISLSEIHPHARADRMAREGVQALICGAVSNVLANLIIDRGITLIPFITGDVDEVLAAYLGGSLDTPRLQMPGCCGGRGRSGQGRGGGRRGNRFNGPGGGPGRGRGRGRRSN